MRDGLCPACGRSMLRYWYGSGTSTGLSVDVCRPCGLVVPEPPQNGRPT